MKKIIWGPAILDGGIKMVNAPKKITKVLKKMTKASENITSTPGNLIGLQGGRQEHEQLWTSYQAGALKLARPAMSRRITKHILSGMS